MANVPTAERAKRYKKAVADFFADIGITGSDQQQARKDMYRFLYQYVEEKEIDRVEDLHYDVAAESYLDELSTKFKGVAPSELPSWYMSLCTVGIRDRQLAIDSINGVLRKQITAVGQKHPRFKEYRKSRFLEEATEASDAPSNSEGIRADTPASEWAPKDDGEPVGLPRGTKRGRKPLQLVFHNTLDHSRLAAESSSNSPRDSVIAAPRMVRDLLDHNVRGLREASDEVDADSEDDMEVLHPRKRLAREQTASSDAINKFQSGDSIIVTSREREVFEIPDSPELGPAPLATVAHERTTPPPLPWMDPHSRPHPAFRTSAKKEVNEKSPRSDHHDFDPYRQPAVRPSPSSSRTDGSRNLLLVMVNALESATEIAELRAQLDQGQQRGYSEDRQTAEAAVPTAKLRKILSLVKE